MRKLKRKTNAHFSAVNKLWWMHAIAGNTVAYNLSSYLISFKGMVYILITNEIMIACKKVWIFIKQD